MNIGWFGAFVLSAIKWYSIVVLFAYTKGKEFIVYIVGAYSQWRCSKVRIIAATCGNTDVSMAVATYYAHVQSPSADGLCNWLIHFTDTSKPLKIITIDPLLIVRVYHLDVNACRDLTAASDIDSVRFPDLMGTIIAI